MPPNIVEIFKPLEAAINSRPMDFIDLMEFLSGFCSIPEAAAGVCLHIRDCVAEDPTYLHRINALLVETYRRAFFDPSTSPLYHTNFFGQDSGALAKFSEYLVQSIAMDSKRHASGSFVDSSAHH